MAKKAKTGAVVSDDSVEVFDSPEVVGEKSQPIEQDVSKPLEPSEKAIAPLNPFMEKIVEFKEYLSLEIKDHTDKKGNKAVNAARLEVRRERLGAEKVIDEIVRPYEEAFQFVKGKGKDLVKSFKDIESDLSDKEEMYEAAVKAEAKRIQEEEAIKFQQRLDQIQGLDMRSNGFGSYKSEDGRSVSAVEIRSMSDDDFFEFVAEVELERQVALEARLKKEQEDKDAADKAAAELKEEQDKLALDKKKLADKQAEIDAANKKTQDDLAEQQRVINEGLAKLKAAEDAAALKEKEAQDKIDSEKKKAEDERIVVRGEVLTEMGFEISSDDSYFFDTLIDDEPNLFYDRGLLLDLSEKDFNKQIKSNKATIARVQKALSEAKEAALAEEAIRIESLKSDADKLRTLLIDIKNFGLAQIEVTSVDSDEAKEAVELFKEAFIGLMAEFEVEASTLID